MTQFLQTLFDGVTVGCLYALIALGYTMVYGILKFINFAHSDIFALGVWMSITIAGWMGVGAIGDPVPAWYIGPLILVLAMATCGLVGFIVERLAYRPLRNAPRINVLITAIGVSLFLQNAGQQKFVFGPYPEPNPTLIENAVLATVAKCNDGHYRVVVGAYPKGELPPEDPAQAASKVEVRLSDAAVIATALALMAALQFLIFHTKFGVAMRAVSFNTRNASLMGINVDLVISFTFVVGTMLAAAAGFLYGLKYGGQAKQTADAMWVMLGLKAFVAAVVGGIGNVRGAVLGGLLIGLIEFFGVAYVSSQYRDAYVFAILILVLLFRPEGVLGKGTVEKV